MAEAAVTIKVYKEKLLETIVININTILYKFDIMWIFLLIFESSHFLLMADGFVLQTNDWFCFG